LGKLFTPDARIARLAARQHGAFTHAQAVACGFTPKTIEYRVATRRWRPAHRGVYVMPGAPKTFEQDVTCVVLAAGPGAAASGRTAGALFGFEGIERGVLEVVVPKHRRVRVRGATVHHVSLGRRDVTQINGIRVTTPARTLIDLAAVLPRHRLEDALDDAVRRNLIRPRELEARLDKMIRRGRAGVGVLLELVRERTARNVPGSGRESRVRRILTRAGLPEPVRQHEIFDANGTFVARVDLAYPDERLYIEYDGAGHESAKQRRIDIDRQNRLTELGWRPLRFTKTDLRASPRSIVTKVRNARAVSSEP
jgi:hypothetical protein